MNLREKQNKRGVKRKTEIESERKEKQIIDGRPDKGSEGESMRERRK